MVGQSAAAPVYASACSGHVCRRREPQIQFLQHAPHFIFIKHISLSSFKFES
jgi:hypothetical protein